MDRWEILKKAIYELIYKFDKENMDKGNNDKADEIYLNVCKMLKEYESLHK